MSHLKILLGKPRFVDLLDETIAFLLRIGLGMFEEPFGAQFADTTQGSFKTF